jgi:prophage maintenance system killer protein
LARNQFFTNGNKRTALLAVRNFIYECGFRLPDMGFPAGWEKLFVEVARAENEEIARKLIKQKIWSEILL